MNERIKKILSDLAVGVPIGCLTIEEAILLSQYFGPGWEQMLSTEQKVKEILSKE